MVAAAVPAAPIRMLNGSVKVPISVPPLSVIVKGAVTDEPVTTPGVWTLIVLANVPLNVPPPLPKFVSVTWPLFVKMVLLLERVVVPVKVSVLLTLAACAPAVTSSARAKGANLLKMVPVVKRFICLLRTGPWQSGIPALYNETPGNVKSDYRSALAGAAGRTTPARPGEYAVVVHVVRGRGASPLLIHDRAAGAD